MALIGIVAVARNGAIGKGGDLAWRFPADMRFFKSQTVGHACLMGAHTWRSLGKPLKDRLNIVMSRTLQIEPQPGLIVLRDKTSVLSLADYLACDLFIIGGAQIYRLFQNEIEKWIVTEVPLVVEEADTSMPEDFLRNFRVTGEQEEELEGDLRVRFYERV